jgi:hypothetical protein
MDIDMRKAWIENERIRDIAHSEPTEIYHPDVAVFYDTEVPDDAENGDGWIDGVLVKPVPYVPEVIDVIPTEETPTE